MRALDDRGMAPALQVGIVILTPRYSTFFSTDTVPSLPEHHSGTGSFLVLPPQAGAAVGCGDACRELPLLQQVSKTPKKVDKDKMLGWGWLVHEGGAAADDGALMPRIAICRECEMTEAAEALREAIATFVQGTRLGWEESSFVCKRAIRSALVLPSHMSVLFVLLFRIYATLACR